MASSAKSRRPQSQGSLLVPPRTRPKHHPQVSHLPAADPSVLRPSINVSVTGMKQAVKALENGSPEIRNYLLHECNVIYECRTCFNMFRSLCNYIAHKRSFCRERLQDVKHVYRRDPGEFAAADGREEVSAFVQPEAVETLVPEKEWDLAEYSPSLELLKEAGLIQEIEARPLVPSLRPPERKPKLDRVVEKLKQRLKAGVDFDFYKSREAEHVVRLEEIAQTSQAVFQTIGVNATSSMGQRYLELQRLKQRPCVFLGPDGTVINPGPPPPQLSLQVTSESGGDGNLMLPCPICKKEFTMSSGLSRHLIRKHKKTTDEANQLTKRVKKTALLKRHKSIYGNVRFGECSYIPLHRDGVVQSKACKKCSKLFQTFNDRLCHEILQCIPEPTVRLQRLQMSVKLEKMSVVDKVVKEKREGIVEKISPDFGMENKVIDRSISPSFKDKRRYLPVVQSTAEHRSSLTPFLDDDDIEEEVTFKKANEDKDSGIGNGNASEESGEELNVVDVDEASSSNRKRRRVSGNESTLRTALSGSTKEQHLPNIARKNQAGESSDRKKGLITEFFPRTENVKEGSKQRTTSFRSRNNR